MTQPNAGGHTAKHLAQILADPGYQRLVRVRNRLSWGLSSVILVAYFSFILTIAFQPKLLAIPVVAGLPMTWGIPAGLGLIVLSFVITAIYVYISNHLFDRLARDVHANL